MLLLIATDALLRYTPVLEVLGIPFTLSELDLPSDGKWGYASITLVQDIRTIQVLLRAIRQTPKVLGELVFRNRKVPVEVIFQDLVLLPLTENGLRGSVRLTFAVRPHVKPD